MSDEEIQRRTVSMSVRQVESKQVLIDFDQPIRPLMSIEDLLTLGRRAHQALIQAQQQVLAHVGDQERCVAQGHTFNLSLVARAAEKVLVRPDSLDDQDWAQVRDVLSDRVLDLRGHPMVFDVHLADLSEDQSPQE